MHDITSVELIKTIIAPGMMISACGLLFLALMNRFLTLTQRIRNLSQERTHFTNLLTENPEYDFSYFERVRLESIEMQMHDFLKRGKMLRNSLTLIITACIFYILTCFNIGFIYITDQKYWQVITLVSFLTGMVILLIGLLIAAVEIQHSYRNILIEVKALE